MSEQTGYVVRLRRAADGVEVDVPIDLAWEQNSRYWWTQGNMECDCNRHDYFERGLGHEPSDDEDPPCGNSRYALVWVKVGNTVVLDGKDDRPA